MLLRGNEGKSKICNLQSEIRGGNLVKRDEIIVGIVIFLFGAATVLLSLRMPSEPSEWQEPGCFLYFWEYSS